MAAARATIPIRHCMLGTHPSAHAQHSAVTLVLCSRPSAMPSHQPCSMRKQDKKHTSTGHVPQRTNVSTQNLRVEAAAACYSSRSGTGSPRAAAQSDRKPCTSQMLYSHLCGSALYSSRPWGAPPSPLPAAAAAAAGDAALAVRAERLRLEPGAWLRVGAPSSALEHAPASEASGPWPLHHLIAGWLVPAPDPGPSLRVPCVLPAPCLLLPAATWPAGCWPCCACAAARSLAGTSTT
mmetsp:Transcript_26223/g.66741  ORF Transcript_26223/g.66741 Transcript_26223/m.66741 type:complete len:237 (+) Transcript_26223:53-763(+)